MLNQGRDVVDGASDLDELVRGATHPETCEPTTDALEASRHLVESRLCTEAAGAGALAAIMGQAQPP